MKSFKYVLLALLIVGNIQMAQSISKKIQPRQKLSYVESIIAEMYVDKVDEDKLVEDAIRGMLEELDPHSTYSTREETLETQEVMQGSFSGIGIQFNMQKDTLYVIQTIAGGPSEKVGILPGDRFIAVDDTVIAGKKMKNTAIMKMLRGKKGTKVDVTVVRRGTAEPLQFRITRDDIPVNSIDAVYMADDKTGYIRLSRFGMTTFTEFEEALKRLKAQGMKQLILDLSDNGGGYMNIAAEIANEMLGKKQLIVYTQGNHSRRQDLLSDGKGRFKSEKVVVMINQFSASASEILAGALQDWDRGVVVGRRSFGKGLVQREFMLPDTSSFRLTIARYYTPSGRNIQKPYVKGDREEYDKDIIDRYNHGEFLSADSIHFADSLKFQTLKNHRTVYGGGGIMPDVFVPLDTTLNTRYYRDLVAKGVITQFALKYVDENRAMLKEKYPDANAFVSTFAVDDAMIDNLAKAGEQEGVKKDDEQFATSKELLRDILKAVIANDLFNTSTYFQVINKRNDIFQEALKIINDEQRYEAILKHGNAAEQSPEKQ